MANQPKKYKKFVATAATATLVASAIVPVASAASFSDVVVGGSHSEAINALADQGIIKGYPDGTFKPGVQINRGQTVKLLGRWLESQGYEIPADWNSVQRFSDVPVNSADQELVKYAALVKDAGVFNGSQGKLNASQPMQRQHMAVVLVRAIKNVLGEDLVQQYKDAGFVSSIEDLDQAYANENREAIIALEYAGITKVSDGNFRPTQTVTRGQFASFLYRTINLDTLNATVESIKAINNTTVEVDFKEAIDNVNALKFTIDGLQVKNAVVKQTDKTVVVLTTAPQEGGKTYTVSEGGKKLGTFQGVSAVIPTGIKVVEPSIQGTIGKEVTVKAQVTVAEGQSKAGIPVTFNIVSDNSNLNNKIEVVAYTNEDGVAEYTYTRYYRNNDQVTAYATDKSSVLDSGKVYWAEALSVTEVTEGNTLANGAKKVYKVKTDSYQTAYDGAGNKLYNYVNVTFKENVDVAPDKLVRDVNVIDTGVSTNANYPSQVTTGGVNEVRVKVDANGEATFTLTGSNASVTPVVFVDADKDGKYDATELQASAPTVKFEQNHTLGLDIKAEGVQNAAAINANGTGLGGRTYTVTVKDKNGKYAPEGTKAYVTFEEGNYSTDKHVYLVDANGNNTAAVNKNTRFEITVGKEGKATFTIRGERDAFAAPTVYLENGKEFGLDKADLQVVGEKTYFVNAVVTNAKLTVTNAADKEVTTLPSSQRAYFKYQSVDQNGFNYYVGTGSYEVSFEVTAQFADVDVYNNVGSYLGTVEKGTTETFKVNATAGLAIIQVDSENVASNVTVNASASQVSLPNKSASISFTKGTEVPAVFTGDVASLNAADNKLTFVGGYDPITYSTTSFKNEAGVVIDEATFESRVSAALAAGDTVKVSAVKNADGTYSLEIESITPKEEATGKLISAVVTDETADASGLLDTITFTFDKAVDASTVSTSDFILASSTYTLTGTPTVSGKTVKIAITPSSAVTSNVDIVADTIGFTDGSGNVAVTGLPVTVGQKVSRLHVAQANKAVVNGSDAKAQTVTIDNKAVDIKVEAANNAGDFNGLKFEFAQNSGDALSVTYNDGVVKVLLPNSSGASATDIETQLAALGNSGEVTYNGKTIDLTNIDVTIEGNGTITGAAITHSSTTLTGGVSGQSAQLGIYKFAVYPSLAVGDTVTVNGITYRKVVSDAAVAANKTFNTAAELLAAILANDSRFDATTSTESSGVITLQDSVANGAAAPTLSAN